MRAKIGDLSDFESEELGVLIGRTIPDYLKIFGQVMMDTQINFYPKAFPKHSVRIPQVFRKTGRK
jgi:hypothetical protein